MNIGELGKSRSALRSNGVAPIDDGVLAQLQKKHPKRKGPIAWPTAEEVQTERHEREKPVEQPDPCPDGDLAELRAAAMKALENVDMSITISAEMIEEAAKKSKRGTAGGLQQITPWHLRQAVESSTNQEVAIAAARLATRWGRGDFSPRTGRLTAAGRLIGLYKNAERVDVRPVCVGDALRRLLCKAYTSNLREKLKALVGDHQLGVLQRGYEIGVHALRELASQCIATG